MNASALRVRFANALKAAGAGRPSDALFDMLVARYDEPHRHYHTLAHVEACLGWLDWYRGSALRPERVELALWFHDAVYEPRAFDNERRSAELARAELAAVGVPNQTITVIRNQIRATQEHRAYDRDGQLLVDLDLTIFGAKSAVFARFEDEIRAEYGHIAEASFALGRSRVLAGFLARSSIYRTSALREELEVRARRNLERRIAELT